MSPPAQVFQWNGRAMIPRHSRLAEQSFTSGVCYRLGIIAERDESQRTLEQNSKMWAMLTEISKQVEHCGKHYDPNQWKSLFLHSIGYDVQFIPSLDGEDFVPYWHSSRKLTKAQMSELLESILAWGTEHGVKFSDQGDQRDDEGEC